MWISFDMQYIFYNAITWTINKVITAKRFSVT